MPSDAARERVERAKRRLRRQFPTGYPVRVMWAPTEDLTKEHGFPVDGDALFHQGVGRIRLADSCNQYTAVETLIHEWAHLLRQLVPVGSDRMVHDAIFWAIYGQVIGAWHGE